MSTINLRKKKRKFLGKREVIVVVMSVVLTTVGIKASDYLVQPEAEVSEGRCPSEMVFVGSAQGGFCIDKYEASPGEECSNQAPGSQNDSRRTLDESGCSPQSAPNTIPWRNISQDQASLACAKAGKRLPTNAEWLQAALGTPDKSGNWDRNDCQVNNNWGAQPGLSGSGQNCKSSAGVYDMIGNVWEWVQGAANDGVYEDKKLPNAGFIDSLDGNSMPGETNPNQANDNYYSDYFYIKHNGIRGIARGGYWDNEEEAGQYSVYMVTPPSSAGDGIGFRCVK